MRRMPCVLGSVAALFMLATAWPVSPALAQEAVAKIDPAVRPEFREPVTLASKDGVLEVRLTAKQGDATPRYRGQAGAEHARLCLRADPRHGVRRQDVGRQSLSGADAASVPRRDADRPSRQRARPGSPSRTSSTPPIRPRAEEVPLYPPTDDFIAAQPAHAWRACQPQGERRQRDAAHPSRHVEHLHLPHSQEHAAGRLLVSLASAHAHRAACLLRPGRSARDRAHRRQSSARHRRTRSRSATCCCSTTTCSIGRAGARRSTTTPGRNG